MKCHPIGEQFGCFAANTVWQEKTDKNQEFEKLIPSEKLMAGTLSSAKEMRL